MSNFNQSYSDRNTYGNHIVVGIGQLSEAMQTILDSFSMDARTAVVKGIELTSKQTAKVARSIRTYGVFRHNDPYNPSISWRMKRDLFYPKAQIYARGHEYSLTHLLENGHKIWNSPTGRSTRAFKHWKPAEDFAVSVITANIVKNLKF